MTSPRFNQVPERTTMSFLDQIAGAVSGAINSSAEGGNPILATVMQLINNPQVGGLDGLIQKFQQGGLGEIVNSWVSTGQNLPISAEQIQSALGSGNLQSIASQLGVSPDQASGQLAEFLPKIVDQLTPNGTVPQGNDLLAQGMDLLKGKFLG